MKGSQGNISTSMSERCFNPVACSINKIGGYVCIPPHTRKHTHALICIFTMVIFMLLIWSPWITRFFIKCCLSLLNLSPYGWSTSLMFLIPAHNLIQSGCWINQWLNKWTRTVQTCDPWVNVAGKGYRGWCCLQQLFKFIPNIPVVCPQHVGLCAAVSSVVY